ncbi:hypothetical protein [Alteromonas gilva]|uniref:Stress protein n=1 Tax=Alteromonas gilva TaxID=2987522 RepID=A0ABT5L5H8_9ALTE|nr:hypothetical protein [Alteromonas gilva]MDC8831112.1 hypothetical protein [Alteromonas gilva]
MSINRELSDSTDNLQRALAGQYKFDLKALFSEGQARYKDNLGLMLRATGVLMAIGIGVTFLLFNLLELDVTSVESMQSSRAGMLDIIMLVLMSPLLVGFRMIGVKIAAGQRAQLRELGQYFSFILVLVAANLLISLLVQVGLNLLILPGIYVYMVTQFSVVLLANRRAGLLQSIVLSTRVVNRYLLPFTLILLVFLLMFILVFVTMGLAILWVGPMYSLIMGRLYVDLFGYGEPTNTHTKARDSILDA